MSIILVTADHSHTMTMGGYPGRLADIRGIAQVRLLHSFTLSTLTVLKADWQISGVLHRSAYYTCLKNVYSAIGRLADIRGIAQVSLFHSFTLCTVLKAD
jgi:hypothetical protein